MKIVGNGRIESVGKGKEAKGRIRFRGVFYLAVP
jgi:hypothetical protein